MEHYVAFGHLVSDVQVGKVAPNGGIPLNFMVGVNSDTDTRKLSTVAKFRQCTYWVNNESFAEKMRDMLKKGTPVTVISENGVTLQSFQNITTGETGYMIALRVTDVKVHLKSPRGAEAAKPTTVPEEKPVEPTSAPEPVVDAKPVPAKTKAASKPKKKAEPKVEIPQFPAPEDDELPF